MTSAAKQRTLELAERHVCPDRVRVMSEAGIVDLAVSQGDGGPTAAFEVVGASVDDTERLGVRLHGGAPPARASAPGVVASGCAGAPPLQAVEQYVEPELELALVVTPPQGRLRVVVGDLAEHRHQVG